MGTGRHEITMIPVYNEEYRKFQHDRQILEDGPKYHTKRMQEDVKPNLLAAGTTGSTGKQFQQFIVCYFPFLPAFLFQPNTTH